jgi:hypothetical protein
MVAPCAGAWIETSSWNGLTRSRRVAPCAGRGSKPRSAGCGPRATGSPRAGAWIETSRGAREPRPLSRPLARGRGLKRLLQPTMRRGRMVAPTRARIETRPTKAIEIFRERRPRGGVDRNSGNEHWPSRKLGVAPCALAWIETPILCTETMKPQGRPLGIVDRSADRVSPLVRGRGSKPHKSGRELHERVVAPCAGRGSKQPYAHGRAKNPALAALRAAWIETLPDILVTNGWKVAPCAGAWIETCFATFIGAVTGWSPLCAGAWIETRLIVGQAPLLLLVAPGAGRGSKHIGRGRRTRHNHVAPCAGAWIETAPLSDS